MGPDGILIIHTDRGSLGPEGTSSRGKKPASVPFNRDNGGKGEAGHRGITGAKEHCRPAKRAHC